MKNQNNKTVTVNPDSTTQQTTLSNPLIEYANIVYLKSLKDMYKRAEKKISHIGTLKRPMDYEKKEMQLNLKKQQAAIESEFNERALSAKKWISTFSDKDVVYGYVIVEYFCNLKSDKSLQCVLDTILIEKEDKYKESNNFLARLRTIALNQAQES